MISYQALREQFTKKLPAMLPQLSIKGFWLNHTVGGHLFDFVADVRVGQVEKRLLGGLQSKGEPRILRQAITELRESGCENADTHFIIVAPYLSERGREVCRRNRIGGVDLVGNIVLEFDGIYIERIAPNPNPARRTPKKGDLFAPVASRILRALLEEPTSLWPIKTLAQATEASLAQVYKITDRLVAEGLGHKDRSGFSLGSPAKLLDSWVENYHFSANQQLGFALSSQKLSDLLQKLPDVADKLQSNYAFTLDWDEESLSPAGDNSTRSIYVEADKIEGWIKKLGLLPGAQATNFYLIRPYDQGVFYKAADWHGLKTVGHIQRYLDLYSTGRLDAANQLRHQKLLF